MKATHWLKATPITSICYAMFAPRDNDHVYVLAVIGATEFIDRTMPTEEARATWRRLKEEGWMTADANEITETSLKMLAYD